MKKDYKKFGKLHKEMWTWLAENYGLLKQSWFNYRNTNEDEYPMNNCFACEYCDFKCYKCPIDWGQPDNWVDKEYGEPTCACELYDKSPYRKIYMFGSNKMSENTWKKYCLKIAKMWPKEYRFKKEVRKK